MRQARHRRRRGVKHCRGEPTPPLCTVRGANWRRQLRFDGIWASSPGSWSKSSSACGTASPREPDGIAVANHWSAVPKPIPAEAVDYDAGGERCIRRPAADARSRPPKLAVFLASRACRRGSFAAIGTLTATEPGSGGVGGTAQCSGSSFRYPCVLSRPKRKVLPFVLLARILTGCGRSHGPAKPRRERGQSRSSQARLSFFVSVARSRVNTHPSRSRTALSDPGSPRA
jgi:hypothetical protein